MPYLSTDNATPPMRLYYYNMTDSTENATPPMIFS